MPGRPQLPARVRLTVFFGSGVVLVGLILALVFAPGESTVEIPRSADSGADHRVSRGAGWSWELPTTTRSDYLSAYARITVSTTELPSASRAVVRSDANEPCPAGIVSLAPATSASRQVAPSS